MIDRIFMHYKNGQFYRVICDDAMDSETKERKVHYQNIITLENYNRPYDMFFGKVTLPVTGIEISRFDPILAVDYPHNPFCYCVACANVRQQIKVEVVKNMDGTIQTKNAITMKWIPCLCGKYDDLKDKVKLIGDRFVVEELTKTYKPVGREIF